MSGRFRSIPRLHRHVARATLTLAPLFFSLGCGEAPAQDPPLVEIGDGVIRLSEFDDYLRRVIQEEAPFARGELKAALLEQFVEEHLLLKAAEDEGIEVASEELRRSEPQAREGGEPQAVMENRLVGDFRALRLEPEAYLRVRKLMDEKVLDDVRVTDEEIAHYYEENRAYYKRPEVVDISQILVETAEEAEAILKDLQARPSRFQELARERSIAPEGDRGGHLGPFRRGELPPSFEKEVFGLRKGKLTHVVKTDFGYHIFRVDEMRPAKQLSLGEAEDAIRVKLLREKSDEALAIYLEELRKRYSVKVHTDRLSFPVPGITHGSR